LTCSHVILDGEVTGHIEVLFEDESTADATIIGVDTQTDLAVIHVDKTGLTPAEFGDSDQTVVGQQVYVIGSPGGIEYMGSFTGGWVSAVNREISVGTQKYTLACIQTDASINPGNSGGPLINEYGQVIGVNSAKLVSTNIEGMGFAIPSNTAQTVVASLLESGYVTGRPRIGITFTSISSDLAEAANIPVGIRVVGIDETCDVAQKDVQIGDIITAIDGKNLTTLNEITALLNQKQPGDSVVLTIYRVDGNGETSTLDVTVLLEEKTN
jgi:serine protease Do